MAQTIQRFISGFDASGSALLTLPLGAETVALRFFENNELNPEICIVLLIDSASSPSTTYQRQFILIGEGSELPANFKKYIATFPFGAGKVITQCIEVTPATPPA